MERERFLYLVGLMPVVLLSVLLFLWLWMAPTPIGWLGLILSPLCCLIILVGWYQAWVYHSNKQLSATEKQYRSKHFLGHVFVLSLGLGVSWLSFQTFKQQVSFGSTRAKFEIKVKNTSQKTVENLKVKLGSYNQTIAKLEPRGEESLAMNVPTAKMLSVELKAEGTVRKAEILVSPEDRRVLVRIDPLLNVLAEVH